MSARGAGGAPKRASAVFTRKRCPPGTWRSLGGRGVTVDVADLIGPSLQPECQLAGFRHLLGRGAGRRSGSIGNHGVQGAEMLQVPRSGLVQVILCDPSNVAWLSRFPAGTALVHQR